MRIVVIIGSGCAGNTAAVYAARANLEPTLITGIAPLNVPSRMALLGEPWLRMKLMLAFFLVAYHVWLWLIHRDFANYRNTHSAKFYRWINEIPALFLIAMVLLAVLKPS